MLKAIKDAETLRKMRWKDGDDTNEEMMDKEQMDELEELPSYFNWLQNCHGTLPRCPVEIDFEGSRDMFSTFLMMTPAERDTTNPDGVVFYDSTIAEASERRNQIGAYAHISNPSNTLTTPTATRSTAAKALAAFEKKMKVGEDTWSQFEYASDWTTWKTKHLGKLIINDMGDMLKDTFVIPIDGQDDPDVVKLYEKQNTHLFIALQDAVKTKEGLTIVKRFTAAMDGVSAWTELVRHYDHDTSAIEKTKYVFGLICTSRIPLNHKGLAPAIDVFKNWVIEHNHYCECGTEMPPNQELLHFERYISSIDKLREIKKLMDVQED